ncbi:MAG: restriction endonuclease subunit S, partial [Endozoicomonadaceae bacterium]|nr:restriction endonuclease subunit S [Endozoicomonadaceae bacterium]
DGGRGGLNLTIIRNVSLPCPKMKEQKAIANALSDVDALISELEKLISKKQAIKTATMQQLLTGRIRLPQFAPQSAASAEFDSGSQIRLDFTSSDESDSASSSVSDSTSFTPSVKPDSSPATSTSSSPLVEPVETNTDTKISKGYKQTEVGVIPADWKVVPFKNLLSIRHGKSQKGVEAENGLYPILATGGQIGWSDNYLWNKPSVLIGRKGTINKPRFVDIPFWTVDTLFYSEIKSDVNAKFIYYKFCMVDWMQYNEASGVPSLNASTIEAVLSATPKKKEQTAIATILSDMDDEIQSLKKRLAKTRQIKQGMMQELLTGKTRLIKPKHKGDSHAC